MALPTSLLYESIRACVRACTRRMGYDVVRYHPRTPVLEQRRRLIEHYGITTVIDIGANVGQYGKELRRDIGYSGRILSFEPVPIAFEQLEALAASDPLWEVFPMAVGNTDGLMDINVSENLVSSSFLEMGDLHVAVAPESKYCATHRAKVVKLDSVFGDLMRAPQGDQRVLLKIDTQGFEKHVVDGARQVLAEMTLVQMELSLVPLYQQEEPFLLMCGRMASAGYDLVSLETGFADPDSGRLLQVDAFFAASSDSVAHRRASNLRNNHASAEARE